DSSPEIRLRGREQVRRNFTAAYPEDHRNGYLECQLDKDQIICYYIGERYIVVRYTGDRYKRLVR
ncbi:MAG: hypothetical protein MUO57_07460, partial [Anaerolineales bacterium]|nr:hypothetical protein [Anaerolineales bacterium]